MPLSRRKYLENVIKKYISFLPEGDLVGVLNSVADIAQAQPEFKEWMDKANKSNNEIVEAPVNY